MSTFDGFIEEFPSIRIDRFTALLGRPAPLAGFLSHVHSDHLVGLESFRSPFVYCSAATRELVLKLEKFPNRMNFQKGILECRRQTYKHLQKLLKPLPLDTPVKIELCPGNAIQVTLLDANHCLGAVMFLVQGGGKAILYTGDLRCETWWIDSLVRHPSIIQYTTGHQSLDKIYLDTTFAVKKDPYRKFPSKAEGVRELLSKISRYPPETIFYFNAWTFGYEEVWRTLATVLDTTIHLDPYRHGIYTSIRKADGVLSPEEVPALCGFKAGNLPQAGILTQNHVHSRLHSCEKGAGCPTMSHPQRPVVQITPIISRHNGMEMHELGAGGGHGDLDQSVELNLSNPEEVKMLLSLCSSSGEAKEVLNSILEMIKANVQSGSMKLQIDELANLDLQGDIPLKDLPKSLANLARTRRETSTGDMPAPVKVQYLSDGPRPLPLSITFPYSRHASYDELRELVSALRPKDIWPNTAPPPSEWTEALSMEALFGDLCQSKDEFKYDKVMRRAVAEFRIRKRKRDELARQAVPQGQLSDEEQEEEDESQSPDAYTAIDDTQVLQPVAELDNNISPPQDDHGQEEPKLQRSDHRPTPNRSWMVTSSQTDSGQKRLKLREEAFRAASQGQWGDFGLSRSTGQREPSPEL